MYIIIATSTYISDPRFHAGPRVSSAVFIQPKISASRVQATAVLATNVHPGELELGCGSCRSYAVKSGRQQRDAFMLISSRATADRGNNALRT